MKNKALTVLFLALMLGVFSLGWANILHVGPAESYTTIQQAIDAAVSGDVVQVAAGSYTEAVYISKNIHLIGAGRDVTNILTPTTLPVYNWNGDCNSIIAIDTSTAYISGFTINGLGLGNDNGKFVGVQFWKSSGSISDCIVKGFRDTVFSGSQDGFGILVNHENSYTYTQNVTIQNNVVEDYNMSGITANEDGTSVTIHGNEVIGQGNAILGQAAQNGILISANATGSITDNEISDHYYVPGGSDSGGIRVTHSSTGVVIAGNQVDHNSMAIYVDNTPGVLIEDNVVSGDTYEGIVVENTNGTVINENTVTGCFMAILALGTIGSHITANDLEFNYYALVTYGESFTITANNFAANHAHIYNIGDPMDMNALILANQFDYIHLDDQIIYGTTILYVNAPKTLIKDNETQTYSVIASYVVNLRGYQVQIKIPKVDFMTYTEVDGQQVPAGPTNFAIGDMFTLTNLFYQTDLSDDNYWLVTVSGSYMGTGHAITGINVVLFTFSMTSKINASALSGSLVDLPLASIILRDDTNGTIEVGGVNGKLIIIDSGEPTMVQTNTGIYPSGMTLPIDPVATAANGYPSVVTPALNLTFADDYNLDYAKYMISPGGGSSIPLIGDFATATSIFSGFNGTTNTQVLTLPAATLNVALNNLADGTYTAWIVVVDDAGNYTIYPWIFVIDKTATGPIIWETQMTTALNPCRTTPNANNSIDLMWANPPGTFKNHIWALSYTALVGGYTPPNTAYPEYPTTTHAIPVAPNPYNSNPQYGWTRVAVIAANQTPTWAGMARDYYYITVFAEDAAGNISAAPAVTFYRESISYWPGDVSDVPVNENPTVVGGNDVSLLTGVWGLTSTSPYWNPIIDVGPSTDYARRSRPKPDNRINIEDMMMFSMNYYNTNYTVYPRNDATEPTPIRIDVVQSINSGQMTVSYNLNDNDAFVRGLNIPIHYGSGLALISVTTGNIWPEDNVLLYTNENNVVEVSASALGGDSVIEGNGTIATLVFAINGQDDSIELMHMIARDVENRDIVIVDNPEEVPTDNDDDVNVIPQVCYLASNYPNPFISSTTVQYGMKDAGTVRISIFNNRGQLIRTLVNDAKAPGTYQTVWNGRDNNDKQVSSGMYLIRMETKGYVQTKKALLLK